MKDSQMMTTRSLSDEEKDDMTIGSRRCFVDEQ